MSALSDVRLSLDLESLQRYLKAQVPELSCSDLVAKQFGTGTSNPTYLLWSASDETKRFVLRRKPTGELLPGAHQIDREFKVMKGVHPGGVPVPKMFNFCEDKSVVGAEFFLMECKAGRLCLDGGASFATGAERAQLWSSIASATASLHNVDYKTAGLADYGKTGNFVERQVKTWARNFEAADKVVQKALQRPQLTADMHRLRDYLLAGMAILQPEPTCVVHGDLNVHNMLIHPTEPRVATILDWEISTLGHPLIDADYVSAGLPGGWMPSGGAIIALPPGVEGVPTQQQFLADYFKKRGLPMAPDAALRFAALVNCFRFCAIVHGVVGRVLSGNAASGTERNQTMTDAYVRTLQNAMALLSQAQGSQPRSSL